jgi:hypothetical protein
MKDWIHQQYAGVMEVMPTWVQTLPPLTVAGVSIGLGFWVLSLSKDRRDFLVIALTAMVYGMMPLAHKVL